MKNFIKTIVALKQTSFLSAEFAAKKRITRREQFLAEMEQVVPWAELEAVIAPVYPIGMRGRPPQAQTPSTVSKVM